MNLYQRPKYAYWSLINISKMFYWSRTQILVLIEALYQCIVRKVLDSPPPPPPRLFKALTPWPSLLPFENLCFPSPLFRFSPRLRYFRQFPPSSLNTLLPLSNQQTFPGLNKYQKGDFTSSTVPFYQKSISKLLNPFTNRLNRLS